MGWIYYCCNLQAVIDAAIPSNVVVKSKRIAYLLKEDVFGLNLNKDEQKILELLREKKESKRFNAEKADQNSLCGVLCGFKKAEKCRYC